MWLQCIGGKRGVKVACLLRRVGTWTRLQGFTASGVSFVCWISEQNYGQQKHAMRVEAGKGREFGREKEEREERKGQPRGKIEAA